MSSLRCMSVVMPFKIWGLLKRPFYRDILNFVVKLVKPFDSILFENFYFLTQCFIKVFPVSVSKQPKRNTSCTIASFSSLFFHSHSHLAGYQRNREVTILIFISPTCSQCWFSNWTLLVSKIGLLNFEPPNLWIFKVITTKN